MDKKLKKNWSAAERIELFHERYGDELDAGATLVELAKGCGLYLEKIVGKDIASAAMIPVLDSLDAAPFEPSAWAEELEDASSQAFSSWPMGAELHDLAAYAIYGIALDGDDESQRKTRIESLIENASALLAESPIAQWKLDVQGLTELETLVLLAQNRWALDHLGPVEPAALALFGGLAERSIRNMMAGPNKVFSHKDGLIPAQEALRWLETRDAFWNSIWRAETALPAMGDPGSDVDEPVFVPVARDGSVFQPGISRKNGFTVGAKGSEQRFAEFGEALAALHKMPVPYWRRPNERKIFGIVRGVRWERLDRSYLSVISDNPTFKLSVTTSGE